MMYINDLSTPVTLYKYVNDGSLFEICEMNRIALRQAYVAIDTEWRNNNGMKIRKNRKKCLLVMHMM